MRWKRGGVSLLLSVVFFAGYVRLSVALEEFYRPNRPPVWMLYAAWGPIMWPFYVFHVPLVAPAGQDLPLFLALIGGCVVDILILTLAIYALLSWRARRKARA